MARRAAKVDANQTEIVEALRGIGASVFPTHMVGNGFPDLVVGFRGINFLLEVKDGSKPPSARRLTKDEEEFFSSWCGEVGVVNNPDEAIEYISQGSLGR